MPRSPQPPGPSGASGSGLSPAELERYSRHLALPEIGEPGQLRLRAGSVLIVGLGGLGGPAAAYLAAAGVGRLGLVDDDSVETSNLQRQVLFGAADVGRPKTEAARDRLSGLNPLITLETHPLRVTAGNAEELLSAFDLVIDGSDNFKTRYVVSDAAVATERPLVSGSLERFRALVTVFRPPDGPCYRCLFPDPPPPGAAPSCAEAGVLGVLPGLVGVLQASEAIKLLLGAGRSLAGRLLTIDLLTSAFRELAVSKDPGCPACGGARGSAPLPLPPDECDVADGSVDDAPFSLSVPELGERLARGERLQIVDVRMPWEWSRGHLADAVLLPLPELPHRLAELDKARETVVYCAVGQRSAYAVNLMRQAGFSKARNLSGGLEQWVARFGPSLARD